MHTKSMKEIRGEAVITCRFDSPPLMPGKYYLDLYLGDMVGDRDIVKDAISFEVFACDVFGTGKLPVAALGPFLMPAQWRLEETILSQPGSSAAIATSVRA